MAEYSSLHELVDRDDHHARTSSINSVSSKGARIRTGYTPGSPTQPLSIQYNDLHKQSWIEVLLRSLGLSLLWNAWCKLRHRPKVELPKQAMRRSRAIALLGSATHILPVSAALLLVAFNLHGYYIGGELAGASGKDDLKLAGLQFAAKLHELMMQASLSLVVVSIVRHELVVGQGIPFGAVFGSIQFSSLSYLWSKEFFGTLKAQFRSRFTKWSLILLIVAGSILFATVGPSSAITMRPRLDDWPAGGTDLYFNATGEQIWPTSLDASRIPPSCANVTLSTDCLSKDWTVIADEMLPFWPGLSDNATMPDYFGVPSERSMRQLYTKQTIGIYRAPWTLATVQMSSLADALCDVGRLWIAASVGYWLVKPLTYSSRFRFRNDASWFIDSVSQPSSMAVCVMQRNMSWHDIINQRVLVPIVDTFCDSTIDTSSPNALGARYQFSGSESVLANYNDTKSTTPLLEFVDLPTSTYGNATVGAFVSFPPSWPGGKSLVACSLDSRWSPVQMTGRRNSQRMVTGMPIGWPDLGNCFLSGTKRINVTASWANFLNPNIIDNNRTVFHEIVSRFPASQNSRWSDGPGFVNPFVESVLATLLTNGLAQTASDAIPQGLLKGCTPDLCRQNCRDGAGEWCRAIMPSRKQGEFGYGGSIYDVPASANKSSMARFEVHVHINGYAYNSRGVTIRLSCAVLLVYCFIAVVHTVFSFFTGLSSQSWDSVSEVVALAMQSQPTRVLRNTCAGIASMSIFSNVVKVAKTGEYGEHLELVFDAEVESAPPLVPEEFYE